MQWVKKVTSGWLLSREDKTKSDICYFRAQRPYEGGNFANSKMDHFSLIFKTS